MKAYSAATLFNHFRSHKRLSTFLATLVLVSVLTAGFIVVSGRAAALGFYFPASVTKIFAGRSASTVAPGAFTPQPAAPISSTLVINEIDYDQIGTDSAEFLELKNVSGSVINLDNYTVQLVNGNAGGAAVYDTIDLPNVNLAAGDYYVICANAATVVNCDLDDGPDTDFIQNGSPDAIGLRESGVLIDAVSYEGNTGVPYTETAGTPNVAASSDSNTVAFIGLSRFADGTDTDNNSVDLSIRCITPGTANISASAGCGAPAALPNLTITDVTANETNAGTTTFTFTVSLSAPAPTGGVTFDIATADGTAQDDNPAAEDNDYVAKSLTGINIAMGNSNYNFDVTVNGDAIVEPTETFLVNVTNVTGANVTDGQGQGTITNDDSPNLSISDISQNEGNGGGPTTYTFTVSLSTATHGGVTFDIATADGTAQDDTPATEDNDYVAKSLPGQTIPNGSDTYQFTVDVNPDLTAELNETFLVNVTNVSGAIISDGQGQGTIQNDDIVPIHNIQGNGTSSPLSGNVVSTRGVVTLLKSNGYFLQEPDASVDADPNTSEGIFVFTSGAPTVSVGNDVTVTGTVTEFGTTSFGGVIGTLTELTTITSTVVNSTGNPLPAPIPLDATILDQTALPSRPQLEKYESMRMTGALKTVAPNDQFSDVYTVLSSVMRPIREIGLEISQPIPTDPSLTTNIPRWDENPERLSVDLNGRAGSSTTGVTSNVSLGTVTGPLDFAFGEFHLIPDVNPTTSPNMSAVPVPTPTAAEFTVGCFNIENFANGATQRQKAARAIREVMRSPDIIGHEEIASLAALQALRDQVNNDAVAALEPNPLYEAYLTGTGAQNLGFLVKTSRVQVISVTEEPVGTYINPLTSMSEPLHDRPPLVLRATVDPSGPNPVPVIVVVNHPRSFIDIGDEPSPPGEGKRVRAKRKAQAESIAALLDSLQDSNPGYSVITVGDFNAFQFNDGYTDPIATIKGTPTADDQMVVDVSPDSVSPDFTNLTDLLPVAERYSFTFAGTSQALDHIIVNANAYSRFTRYAIARFDSDFPGTPAAAFVNDASRPEGASDHDAPVAYFDLTLVPTVTTSVSSLPDFGSVTVGSTSTEQNYTVSGSNLAGDITINAPADFQVSTTGGGVGFGPSVTLTQVGGTVGSTTIYVRFAPGTTGAKTGDITNASTGATTKNVAVSGTGLAPCVTPATVYVDDSWIGTSPGTDPDSGGPATNFGCDSFATIQNGVTAVPSSGTVIVRAGTYTEDVTINKIVTVNGAQTGVNPNDGSWNDTRTNPANESIIHGAVNLSLRNNIVFDGFTIERTATNEGHMLIGSGNPTGVGASSSFNVKNNRFVGTRNTASPGSPWAGIHTNFLNDGTLPGAQFTSHQNRIEIAGTASGSGILINANLPGTDGLGATTITATYVANSPGNGFNVNRPGGSALISGNRAVNDDIFTFRANNTVITSNTISDAPQASISNTGGSTSWTASNNTIISPRAQAFLVGSTFTVDPVSGMTISGNIVTVDPSLVGVGVTTLFSPLQYAFVDIRGNLTGTNVANNNSISLSSNPLNPAVVGVYGLRVRGNVANLSVTNNTFDGNGVGGAGDATVPASSGLFVDNDAVTTSLDLAVQNNLINGWASGVSFFDTIPGAPVAGVPPVQIISNTIRNNSTGVRVEGQGLANLNFNRIVGNSVTGLNNVDGIVTAENNWWGCNAGPGNAGCDTVTGTADFNPWLVLGVSASPNPIPQGGNSTVTADMRINSDAVNTSGSGTLPPTPVTWSATQGTMAPPAGTITAGLASSTFTSNSASSGTGCATVDNQLTCTNITVVSFANVSGTKTKSGGNTPGSNITYTVVLSNSGGTAQADNPGNEFTDTLPSSLTLVSASSTSGTAAVAGNTATWNGSIGAGGSVTITINATINSSTAPQVVSNQGTINYDSDNNNTNDASRMTDDPAVGGASDPTNFTVVSPADVSGTKTKAGGNNPGQTVTYTVVLSNSSSSAQLDNPGNEFIDTLPSSLTLVSASATSGTAAANVGTNTVSWNGSIPGNGSVTITITATINNVPDGTIVSNQGTISYDADGNGTNEATRMTDDPAVGGASDTTSFAAVSKSDLTITKTHSGNFSGGQVGATYTITVSNIGTGVTSGLITVTDTVPVGLTPTGPNGVVNGWTCSINGQTVTCTRSDTLTDGSSYPPINLTVNVANPAPLNVVNTVTVSGGGEVNTANNTASDSTAINCSTNFALNNTSPLMISRFRENGPAGPQDEFVEIYNPSPIPHTVASGNCNGGGYGVYASSGNGTTSNTATMVCYIPNGTVIPAGGYYLCTGVTYSLGNLGLNGGAAGATATGDAPIGCGGTCGTNIPDDAGLVLTNKAEPTVTTPENFGVVEFGEVIYDKVGFGPYGPAAPAPGYPSFASIYCEGGAAGCLKPVGDGSNGPPCTNPSGQFPVFPAPPACYGLSGQYEFLRRQTTFSATEGTFHQDTNHNGNDFILISPNPGPHIGVTITGVTGVTAVLGAARPYNRQAPPDMPAVQLTRTPFDGPDQLGPRNVERRFIPDPTIVDLANNPLGTFVLRFKYTNNSGSPINVIRFETDNLSTLCGPQTAAPTTASVATGDARNLSSTPGCGTGTFTAIFKALNSTSELVVDGGGMAQFVNGTVMEDLSVGAAPGAGPLSPKGGGIDSTFIINPSSDTASVGDGVTGGTGNFATVIGTTDPTKVLRVRVKFGVVRSGRFILLLVPMARNSPAP